MTIDRNNSEPCFAKGPSFYYHDTTYRAVGLFFTRLFKILRRDPTCLFEHTQHELSFFAWKFMRHLPCHSCCIFVARLLWHNNNTHNNLYQSVGGWFYNNDSLCVIYIYMIVRENNRKKQYFIFYVCGLTKDETLFMYI